jgi:hypothetical protein
MQNTAVFPSLDRVAFSVALGSKHQIKLGASHQQRQIGFIGEKAIAGPLKRLLSSSSDSRLQRIHTVDFYFFSIRGYFNAFAITDGYTGFY